MFQSSTNTKKILRHKTINYNSIWQSNNKTCTYFNSKIQYKKTSFNMKPKTNRRLIVLLTFMLADYNVLASISCMDGCQHDGLVCEPTATGCSDGEICSRFQMEEVDDGMDGEWLKIKKRTSKFQSNLFFIVKFFIT